MQRIEADSAESRTETLVLYCSSPTTYGIRVKSGRPNVFQFVSDSQEAPEVTSDPRVISLTEYNELSALRKAHAWGTPMFQPAHPRYEETMARLKKLEAKELATAAQWPFGHPGGSAGSCS